MDSTRRGGHTRLTRRGAIADRRVRISETLLADIIYDEEPERLFPRWLDAPTKLSYLNARSVIGRTSFQLNVLVAFTS